MTWCVERLLDYGADPNIIVLDPCPPGRFEGYSNNSLTEASPIERESVEILLDLEATIDAESTNTRSPLSSAAYHGNMETAQLLLS